MSTPSAPPPLETQRPSPQIIVTDGQAPAIEFRRWSLVDEPITAAIAATASLLASLGVALIAGSLWWSPVAAAILLGSLWRMWLPVQYRLWELGVEQTVWRWQWTTPWDRFIRSETQQRGVFLLPQEKTSFGRISGLYIPCGEEKGEVAAIADHYLPRNTVGRP